MRTTIRLAKLSLIAATAIFTASPARADEAADAKAKVLFTEDFESGLDRWELLDPKTWKLTAAEGNTALEITSRESEYAPPHRSPLHVALVKDLTPEDFEITFRVRSTRDTGNHRDCCVFFGYQDPKHFYYVHLGALPDPHSGQIMIVDDAPRLAMTENKTPVPWDDAWHNVRLVRRGSDGTIEVYFDDMNKPLMVAKNDKFGAGRVGIGSFDDMDAFDDLVIRELPSK